MSSSQRWSPGLRGRVLVHGRLAIFSDSPSSADLIRIHPQPRRMTARILKLAEREVWFVERAAFLCFMDNFFPFLPPPPFSLFFFFFAHNGLSLPGLILFMILEEEVMEVEKVEEGEVGHDEL